MLLVFVWLVIVLNLRAKLEFSLFAYVCRSEMMNGMRLALNGVNSDIEQIRSVSLYASMLSVHC